MASKTKYGYLSFTDRLGIVAIAIASPLALLYAALTAPFSVHWKKPWRRILGMTLARHKTRNGNVRQIQWEAETTIDLYRSWSQEKKLDIIIDDIEEDAKLLWLGEKRTDRVLLYLHGGGFILPLEPAALAFLLHLKVRIRDDYTQGVGIAILDYSLAPFATFPTPLRQANAAISHLFSCGVAAQNLQMVGDSAGGNLILQVLSHTLRPLPSIPPSPLAPSLRGEMKPVKGAYLLSPWVIPSGHDGGSFSTNDKNDIISKYALQYWGSQIVPRVPSSQRSYIEPRFAPPDWFRDGNRVFERLLVTAGGQECLRDDIVLFTNQNLSGFKDLTMIVQDEGVHNEPIYGMSFQNHDKKGEITTTIVKWLKQGFYE